MKAHASTGATLTLKNLFGLSPNEVYGAPLRYLHAPIRLPRVLVDLALIYQPCLCVVDGIVGAEGHEWHGRPLIPGLILAGTDIVTTDTVGMRLMGMSPEADYPCAPFTFDRNPLLLAARAGLGTAGPSRLTVHRLNAECPVGASFTVDNERDPALVAAVRRSTAEQALYDRDHHDELVHRYAGQYILLAEGQVLAAVSHLRDLASRTDLAQRRNRPGEGVYLKHVTHDEPERMDVYANVVAGQAGV